MIESADLITILFLSAVNAMALSGILNGTAAVIRLVRPRKVPK